MNIPDVSVSKAGNGIFIEYFREYLGETPVITNVFVLLRNNFCIPKMHLCLCLPLCLTPLFPLCLWLIVYTVALSVPFYLSICLLPQPESEPQSEPHS